MSHVSLLLASTLLAMAATSCNRHPALPAGGVPPVPDSVGHHEIRVETLPPPNATGDATNPPKVVDRPAGARLAVPPGFSVSVFAEGDFTRPRWITTTPSGDVLVADADANEIVLLADDDHDGKAEVRHTFVDGLNKPFGMAFAGGWFYVGNTNGVVRFAYTPGSRRITAPEQTVTDLPGRGYREHWTRNVVAHPDGRRLFVTIGSQSNVASDEDPRRATIEEVALDGSTRRTVARGMRNPIGLDFNPTTSALWAAVQERDRLGDDLAPDFVTEVRDGAFYGWPFSYAGAIVDPRRKGEHPELVARAIPGDVLLQAHSAVMDIKFYTGAMFPPEYRGDAFATFHGSWNRSKRTGYKIVRIHFENGRPVGGYDDFLTGWMLDENGTDVWGRPVGMTVARDGSLLVVDDGANKVWRISHGGTAPPNP
jgi:glucose/arabinose dehydrogenase